MREILFRGKRTDNGEWMEGYYAVIGERKVIIALPEMYYDDDGKEYYGNEIKDVDPETVYQYTGLTDNNDMKIFEGDIVKAVYDDYVGIVKFGNYDNGYGYYVEWISGRARYCRQDLFYWVNNDENFEIVGNIYDNPEIMEEESVTYEL